MNTNKSSLLGEGVTALRYLIALLVLVCLSALTVSAQAVSEIGPRTCTLAGQADASPAAILVQRSAFDCGTKKFQKATDHLWIVVDVSAAEGALAAPVLRARLARQGAISVHVLDADGTLRSNTYPVKVQREHWRSPSAGAFALTDAPTQVPQTLLIGVSQPWDPANWFDLQIMSGATDAAIHDQTRMLSALFCGLLFAPLMVNFVLFALLRRRFVLFHGGAVTAMLVTQLAWSGLAFDLLPGFDMVQRSVVGHLAISLAISALGMLIHDLCEPEKLGRWGRRALVVACSSNVVITAAVLILSPRLPLIGSYLFHAGILLVVATGMTTLTIASVRGSKIAMVQLVGLFTGMLIVMSRSARALGLVEGAPVMDIGMYAALFAEASATAMIVGYKALLLRRERDVALKEHTELRALANTDPLTGLPNRRAFIRAYGEHLENADLQTMRWSLLVLDIDHFKRVNDTLGHDAGDLALRQLSDIIDRTCLNFDLCGRFGGEEFVLLAATLQAEGGWLFADTLRERVATHRFGSRAHPIGRMTISVGLIDLDPALDTSFEACFAAADRALYKAKAAGRNRVAVGTQSENIELSVQSGQRPVRA